MREIRRVYLSGKITGLGIEVAKTLFKEAGEQVVMEDEENVVDVINPMAYVREGEEKTWKEYMVGCLRLLSNCNEIYMLKNWKESRGAKIELNWAIKQHKNITFQK